MRIFPLLRMQYADDLYDEPGSVPEGRVSCRRRRQLRRLRVLDAFFVKYSAAGGQKRLPLHSDESEYSLTIAMNSLCEYENGGTYFFESDRVKKTDTGGIISFEGECEHAGEAITSGTRYIIVVFLYSEAVGSDL